LIIVFILEFDKQCEIYSQQANTSTASKSRISMTYCYGMHQYVCVDGNISS